MKIADTAVLVTGPTAASEKRWSGSAYKKHMGWRFRWAKRRREDRLENFV